jgi:hypothetical protein
VQRDTVLVALVAGLALLAFGVGANSVNDVADSQQGRDEIEDGQGGDLGLTAPDEVPPDTSTGGTQPFVERFTPQLSPALLAVLGVLLLLAVGALALDSDDDGERDLPPAERMDDKRDETGIDLSRGFDFDPDSPGVTNEVYRAYRDFTERVPTDRAEATTPREYAARARRIGLDGDAVETVTDAFQQVRYGGQQPGESLERRAREAVDALGDASGDPEDGGDRGR